MSIGMGGWAKRIRLAGFTAWRKLWRLEEPTYAVSGSVVLDGESPEPAGRGVTLFLLNDHGPYWTMTVGDGTFQFDDVLAGTYTLLAVLDGYFEYEDEIEVVDQDIKDVTVELELAVFYSVSGKVGYLDDVFVGLGEGIEVKLIAEDEGEYVATTNAESEYLFEAVLPGTYDLIVEVDGYELYEDELVVEDDIDDNDIELTPEVPATTYTVGGEVYYLDDQVKTPIGAGAVVTLDDGEDQYTDTTDQEGKYEITDVPAGTYTLTVELAGYEPYEDDSFEVEDNIADNDIELTPEAPAETYTVSGEVYYTDDGTPTPVGAGAEVKISDGETDYTDITDADGLYEITDVPAGTYTLTVELAGYEPYEDDAFEVEDNVTGNNIELTPENGNGNGNGDGGGE